jgi:metallo-beta-lactamase family protein
MGLKLTFHGAAGTVTGSRHLVETDRGSILVDAGLFQGLKKLRLLNWEPPAFDPKALDHVILTHSHIDHAGYLPKLVQRGFKGPVHCTRASLDLAELLLMDSAKIQEEDAAYANRKKFSKHSPALPLYTAEDAEQALRLLIPYDYEEWFDIEEGVRARFTNAGHILGSAIVELQVGRRTIVFSGDVGKYDMPIHPNPKPCPGSDILVVESTYGDRVHEDEPFADQIRDALLDTVNRGGTILIPSFAVARSQVVIYLLREAMKAGDLPELPIHLDSPMAIDATKIYSRHLDTENLDPEIVEDGRRRLFPRNVQFHRSVEESKELNRMTGPRIIVSASGMLTAGRVVHHLARLLPHEENLILLVGYQAAGTRGRALQEGAESLRMHGRSIPIRAHHFNVHGLSAHADRNELLRWVKSSGEVPNEIYVVHGEPDSARSFATLLEDELSTMVHVPELGESFSL